MTVPAAENLRIAIQSMWPDLHDDNEAHMTYAADLLDAIDDLHHAHGDVDGWFCHHDGFTWPCPTARLLHPEEGE